eukprot:gene5803-8009_t
MIGERLLNAAGDGNVEEVIQLLSIEHVSVNYQNKSGSSPLHYAARNCRINIIPILVNKRAEINLRTQYGNSPLDLARKSGNTNSVAILENYISENNKKNDFISENKKLVLLPNPRIDLQEEQNEMNSQKKNDKRTSDLPSKHYFEKSIKYSPPLSSHESYYTGNPSTDNYKINSKISSEENIIATKFNPNNIDEQVETLQKQLGDLFDNKRDPQQVPSDITKEQLDELNYHKVDNTYYELPSKNEHNFQYPTNISSPSPLQIYYDQDLLPLSSKVQQGEMENEMNSSDKILSNNGDEESIPMYHNMAFFEGSYVDDAISMSLQESFPYNTLKFNSDTEELISTSLLLANKVYSDHETIIVQNILTNFVDQESTPWNHGVLIVVGPGKAGKTQLCNGIAGKPFQEVSEPTRGIDKSITVTVEQAAIDKNGEWKIKNEKEELFLEMASKATIKELENQSSKIENISLEENIDTLPVSSTNGNSSGKFTEEDNQKIIELITNKQWLNSITVYTNQISDYEIAPIALIGTHQDIIENLSNDSEYSHRVHHDISDLLSSEFSEHPAFRSHSFIFNTTLQMSNLVFFPVNNRIGREDPVTVRLMHQVETVIKESSVAKKKVYFSWMKSIDQLTLLGKSYMTRSEVNQTNHTTHFINQRNLHRDYNLLLQTGQVTEPLLKESLLSAHLDNYDAIIKMMLKFELMVELLEVYQPVLIESLGSSSNDVFKKEQYPIYLVPSLLCNYDDSNYDLLGSSDTKSWHQCILVFTLSKSFLLGETMISSSQLRSAGFLPIGIFERICVKSLKWCQRSSLRDEFYLFRDVAFLRFGKQQFKLTHRRDMNSIQISISGENPMAVLNRITSQLLEVISTCKSIGLEVFAALPFIHETNNNNDNNNNYNNNNNNYNNNNNNNEYNEWNHDEPSYIPLSLLQGLVDDNSKIGAFFKEDFGRCLINSKIVTPIISLYTLESVKTDPNEIDNLLLEWMLAIEGYYSSQSLVDWIYPILRVDVWPEDTVTKKKCLIQTIFSPGWDNIPVETEKFALSLLTKYGCTPSPEFYNRNIRDLFLTLLVFLGCKSFEEKYEKTGRVVWTVCEEMVNEVVTRPRKVHMFDIREWLAEWKLIDYHQSFVDAGFEEVDDLQALKKRAEITNDDIIVFRKVLVDVYQITMKPVHVERLLTALNNLS